MLFKTLTANTGKIKCQFSAQEMSKLFTEPEPVSSAQFSTSKPHLLSYQRETGTVGGHQVKISPTVFTSVSEALLSINLITHDRGTHSLRKSKHFFRSSVYKGTTGTPVIFRASQSSRAVIMHFTPSLAIGPTQMQSNFWLSLQPKGNMN